MASFLVAAAAAAQSYPNILGLRNKVGGL